MNKRDAAIRISGLLQAIMSNPSIPPADWEERLIQAVILHNKILIKVTGGKNGAKEE